jgi:prophage antirepressor-like protein
MEGQLVKKTYNIDNISFDCWMINISNKFWFKAHGAVVFLLDYKDPDDAVRRHVPPEARQQWVELEPRGFTWVLLPPNWQPHTVFISEGGLYRLICRSRKPEAVRFERWVFDEVLPTLRETGQYKLHEQLMFKNELIEIKDKLTEIKNERITVKDEQIVQLRDKVSELSDRVAVMTDNDKTKHIFAYTEINLILKSLFLLER